MHIFKDIHACKKKHKRIEFTLKFIYVIKIKYGDLKMNRKQYIIFTLIYYPLSLVSCVFWVYLYTLGQKPGMSTFGYIGTFIMSLNIIIRLIYGKKRLIYLGKSKWLLLFGLFALTEPFFHIAMCIIKDKSEAVSALEDNKQA